MRNLRKLTAAVLAVALVLTSMTAVFAATDATQSTTTAAAKVVNGDKAAVLKELKLYEGKDAKDPKVGLEDALKVQEALMWLATEFGYKAEADKLADADVTKALAKFADAKDVADYAKKVVAYSAQEGIIAGEKDKAGKLYIKPTASVKATRFATFMLKGLGYDLKGSFTESVAQLKEVDGSKISGTETGDLSRDAAVGMMYGVLTAKTKAGKTVAEKLVAADASLQAVASKNSLLPVNGKLAVDTVMAVANNKVAVTLKEAAAVSAADIAIVKKGTTTAVAVKNVVKESDKLYTVETDALTAGTSYTLTVAGAATNFTGIAADNTAPTVVKVTSPDTNTFEVEYSDKMDFTSATDLVNYTFDKSLKVVKAELNGDRNKIKLTTDVAKRNVYYSLTIKDVKNSDGKSVAKTTRNIVANEDRTAPRLNPIQTQNNRMLVLKFEDTNGMNKAALETVANYSINDLAITSATAYDTLNNNDGKFDTVVLMTETQTANKSYTLTIENLVDNSVLANPLGKVTRSFRGMAEDKTAPTVVQNSVKSHNNNEVEISFSENNAMDAASLEDISNYTITVGSGSETLQVISAKAADTKYPDGYKTKKVTLTTAAQDIGPSSNGKTYKVEVKGVTDEFGNALKQTGGKYLTYNFLSSPVDTAPPAVSSVEYKGDKIRLHFTEELKKATVTDPSNYSINKDIGAPIKATLEKDASNADRPSIVELTTPTLSGNTTYEIKINNVEDMYGNAVQDAKVEVLATSKDLDTTVPTISYIYAANKNEIQIYFDEKMDNKNAPTSIVVKPVVNNAFSGNALTFNYSGVVDDGKTLVYKSTSILTADTYAIADTTGRFADVAGNKIVTYSSTLVPPATELVPKMDDRTTFAGNASDNERPIVEYIEQVNVKKLKVVFSEPVFVPKDFGNYTVEKGNTDIVDDYQREWTLKSSSVFTVGKEYSFNFFGGPVLDLGGQAVKDNDDKNHKTTYTTYMEDKVNPAIISVVAVNKNTIEVTYDEELDAAGSYKITRDYTDTNGKDAKEIIGIESVSKDKEKVTVKTKSSSPLKLANLYYLQPTAGAKDIAGNRETTTDVRFDFAGSDVVANDFVKGVGILNALHVYATATQAIKDVAIYEVIDSTKALIPTTAAIYREDSNKKATVTLQLPVLDSKKYEAAVTYETGATETFTFTGNTPDIGLKLDRVNANEVSLTLNGYKTADYVAKIFTTDTSIALTTIPGTPDEKDDQKYSFKTPPATSSEYYVVLYSAKDTETVVYASKVTVNP